MPKLSLIEQLRSLFHFLKFSIPDIDKNINDLFEITWKRFIIRADKELEADEKTQLEKIVSEINAENRNLFLTRLAENKRIYDLFISVLNETLKEMLNAIYNNFSPGDQIILRKKLQEITA